MDLRSALNLKWALYFRFHYFCLKLRVSLQLCSNTLKNPILRKAILKCFDLLPLKNSARVSP